MILTETTQLSAAQQESLLALWNNEYPKTLFYSSIAEFENYLNELKNAFHFLLVSETGNIAGWCFSFEREQERWFAIILSRRLQGAGQGTALLTALKQKHQQLSGWVIDKPTYQRADGSAYPSPLPFYLKNGFTLHPSIRLENEKLSAVKVEWHEKFRAF